MRAHLKRAQGEREAEDRPEGKGIDPVRRLAGALERRTP